MNPSLRRESGFMAWLASLPLALTVPAVLWTIMIVERKDIIRFHDLDLFIVVISCGVHLASYLLTGLPIFLIIYRKPESLIWKLPVGLIVGAMLGAGVPFIIWLLSNGSVNPTGLMPPLICAGYGVITAIAAYRQRPTTQTA